MFGQMDHLNILSSLPHTPHLRNLSKPIFSTCTATPSASPGQCFLSPGISPWPWLIPVPLSSETEPFCSIPLLQAGVPAGIPRGLMLSGSLPALFSSPERAVPVNPGSPKRRGREQGWGRALHPLPTPEGRPGSGTLCALSWEDSSAAGTPV